MNPLTKPIEFEIAGKAFKIAPSNIVGVLLILLAIGYQLSNRGGITQTALPESASQKILNDLRNVSEASGEKAVAETQFSGVIPEDVDLTSVHSTAEDVIAAANALHAGSQLYILAKAKERKDEIVKAIAAERNNSSNKECFATEWKDARCLNSLLENRKTKWEEARKTPSQDDDLIVANEIQAFALVIQEIISAPLGVEADLLKVYDAQLAAGNLTIDSAKAYAAIFNLSLKAQEALNSVQTANDGATASISNRTDDQNNCLNSGVINAETAKNCGVKPE